VAAAAAAAAVWFWLPAGQYMAYVRLYMPIQRQHILFRGNDEQEFSSFQRTQFVMLRSRRVVDKALNNPTVKQMDLGPAAKSLSAADWLERQIQVGTPDGPELPRVMVLGDEPALPKVLVTAVVDAYLEEMSANQQAHQQKRIDALKQILATYDERLQRLQKTKNELARAAGASSDKILILQQELLQKQLAQAKSELVTVTADLRRWELEAQMFQGREGASPEVPEALIDAQIDKDLEKEIALRKKLEERLAQAKTVLDNPDDPTLKRYREELEAQTKFIDEQRKDPRVRERVKAGLLAQQKADGKTYSALLKDKIAFSRQLGKLLEAEVERLQLEVKELNSKAIDLDSGRIDLQQAEAGVNLVKSELEKATVELPAPARVRRYDDEAIVVAPDEFSRRFKASGMGAASAVGAVLLLGSFLEFHRRRGRGPGVGSGGEG
jgi:hypothetical protein